MTDNKQLEEAWEKIDEQLCYETNIKLLKKYLDEGNMDEAYKIATEITDRACNRRAKEATKELQRRGIP